MYLVVDDSKIARKMAVKNLTLIVGESAKIIEAQNGLEAVELYKAKASAHDVSLNFILSVLWI